MKKIKRISLSEQVMNSIIEYIQEKALKPGDQLPTENEFAELFDVSRTSIREAMKALSMNGIVASTPGKGTFLQPQAAVLGLSKNSILCMKAKTTIVDLMEVRLPLEIKAAELAAIHCTEEDAEQLEQICNNYAQVVRNKGDYSIWGREFHKMLATIGGNALLVNVLESLVELTNLYRGDMARNRVATEYYVHSQKVLCQAVRSHDIKGAAEEMERHMNLTKQELLEMVSEENAREFML